MTTKEPIIDCWVAPFSEEKAENWRTSPQYSQVSGLFQNRDGLLMGTEATIKEMDAASVRFGLIGGVDHPHSQTPNDWVAEQVARYPKRLVRIAGVNAEKGMAAVRELEDLVRNGGCRGLRIFPYGHKRPPNHAVFYPLYSKCIELNIPVQMQMGHTAPMLPSEVGRPIYLDEVAIHFPELKIVAAHLGYPWTDEMISIAWKHKNVYIDTTAHAPKYFQPQFVHYMNSYGQDKVIFGTAFPGTLPSIKGAIDQINQLGLKPEARRKFLWENAAKVWNIDVSA
jgi:predicted TIM-barrel fold metal-dependent hydrolase